MLTDSKDAFRIRLVDTVQSLANSNLIQSACSCLLGEYLDANRVGFADFNDNNKDVVINYTYTHKVSLLKGNVECANFRYNLMEQLQKGVTNVVQDIDRDNTLSEANRQEHRNIEVQAAIDIPVIRNGQLKAILFIHYASPKSWSDGDIRFCEEIAQRIWDMRQHAKAEETLTQIRKRQDFIIQLTDGFRVLDDCNSIQTLAVQALGKYLGANRVGFAEPLSTPGLVSVRESYNDSIFPLDGIYRYDDYGVGLLQELMSGRTIVRSNIPSNTYITSEVKNAYAVLQLGATINVPCIKQKKIKSILFVHFKNTHEFTTDEILLIEEVASRTMEALEHNYAVQALRLAEERQRIALAAAEMGTWDWDLETDIVQWNDQHAFLFGLQTNELPVSINEFSKFIHPDDVTHLFHSFRTAVENKGIVREEYRIRRADNGEYRWMADFGRVTDIKDGKAMRMMGVMQDITERKALENQQEDFLGIASHELKTPITTAKVYTEILRDLFKETQNETYAGYMLELDTQMGRLISLVNSLLDTTKIKTGQLHVLKEKFDINNLIREQIVSVQHLSVRHRILFVPAQVSCLIEADRQRIGQVVSNLLSNAIKYSPDKLDIIVAYSIQNKRIQVSVEDQGIGIPHHSKDRIFERFFRMDLNRQNLYPGIGLGLYISSGIIHQHGGRLWVDSEEGKGSTFYFDLPL